MDPNKNMSENMMPKLEEMNLQMANTANQLYPTESMPKMTGQMTYQAIYPEIFYKVQPYILMVCDQMDTYGSMMPSQEMIEEMSDHIYDDVCRMFPDIAEYGRSYDNKPNDPPDDLPVIGGLGPGFFEHDFGRFGRRFRRRGLPRDLIEILLLSELFRRRRRF